MFTFWFWQFHLSFNKLQFWLSVRGLPKREFFQG